MNILLEASKLVHGHRGADYGSPLEDFSRTAAMWSAIIGHPVTAEQVGLCMCALKISRQCNKPKLDNLVDLAGYAETVNMVIMERQAAARALTSIADDFPLLPGDVSPACACLLGRQCEGCEE